MIANNDILQGVILDNKKAQRNNAPSSYAFLFYRYYYILSRGYFPILIAYPHLY